MFFYWEGDLNMHHIVIFKTKKDSNRLEGKSDSIFVKYLRIFILKYFKSL